MIMHDREIYKHAAKNKIMDLTAMNGVDIIT